MGNPSLEGFGMMMIVNLAEKQSQHPDRRGPWIARWMLAPLCCFLIVAVSSLQTTSAHADEKPLDVLVVVGAAGTDEFGSAFAKWADVWRSTCDRAGLSLLTIGPGDQSQPVPDRNRIETVLKTSAETSSVRPLWVVLIGHGTWDGKAANFNLVGPDVSAKELGEWIQPIKRPLVLINCTSSSGPFIDRLSAKDRVIVTATKSGSEQNFSRFGEYFAAAFGSLDADLDHDDAISIREAFLKAAADADRFYKEQGRLATEHALLDDNSDKKGSSYELVRGKAKSKGEGIVDGSLASQFSIPATTEAVRLTDEQLTRRKQLEDELDAVKMKFENGDQAELRENALPILLELAKLYAHAQQ
jgi:hypothetical protein